MKESAVKIIILACILIGIAELTVACIYIIHIVGIICSIIDIIVGVITLTYLERKCCVERRKSYIK
jgi:hypothetical protein